MSTSDYNPEEDEADMAEAEDLLVMGVKIGTYIDYDRIDEIGTECFYNFEPTTLACAKLGLFACKALTLDAVAGTINMQFGLDDDLKEQPIDRLAFLEFLLNVANETWS